MMPEYQEKQNGLATVYCVINLKRLTPSTRTDLASRKNIGSFSKITDIVPGTGYYIKAYAISDGIISYGDKLYDLFYIIVFFYLSVFFLHDNLQFCSMFKITTSTTKMPWVLIPGL